MIEIDGSQGEGGGQVLRTSLTLSLITSQPIRIHQIRAGRKPSGLRPQHLKCVEAAAKIGGGNVIGATIGSTEVEFVPGKVNPGKYCFEIGTAGSTSLLLQTILLPLCISESSSTLTLRGGTHVPWSPCYHYLSWQWIPYLTKMGFDLDIALNFAGYYPKGGGEIKARLNPVGEIIPINLDSRGNVMQIRGISAVSNLPRKIAERQRNQVLSRLGSEFPLNDIRITHLPSNHKGTLLLLQLEGEHASACFFGLGALGKPAETVADEAIDALLNYVDTNGAIDPYLADQILLPMALAKGHSSMLTSRITQHLVTNAKIIEHFLPVRIEIESEIGLPGRIRVYPGTPTIKDG